MIIACLATAVQRSLRLLAILRVCKSSTSAGTQFAAQVARRRERIRWKMRGTKKIRARARRSPRRLSKVPTPQRSRVVKASQGCSPVGLLRHGLRLSPRTRVCFMLICRTTALSRLMLRSLVKDSGKTSKFLASTFRDTMVT